MKSFFTFIFLFLYTISNAQDISFADTDLESYLLSCYCSKDLNGASLSNIDVNNDSVIQVSEASIVGELDITGFPIDNLSGIEFFTNLLTLTIETTSISTIQSSMIPNSLRDLNLNGGIISNIDLSNLSNLEAINLTCPGSDCEVITNLNLNNLSSLGVFYNRNVEIQQFNYSGLPSLRVLNTSSYPNITLNLTSSSLETLKISNAPNLSQVDLNNLNLLKHLSFSNVGINNLDLSLNVSLEYLSLSNMTINNLDLSQNPSLSSLSIINFNTLNLDISNSLDLELIVIRGGLISNLQLPSLTNVTRLEIFDNIIPLSIFNSSFHSLTELFYMGNQISDFDISPFTNLHTLYLSNNNLLQLSGTNPMIKSLNLSDNPLTFFDSSNLEGLESLAIYQTPMTTLDVSNSPNFRRLACDNSLLTELDFSNNPMFRRLEARNVPLEKLNIKNGTINYAGPGAINITNHPSSSQFRYLCADADELDNLDLAAWLYPSLEINSYCSFNLGGTSNQIVGNVLLDGNNNGCDLNDNKFLSSLFSITDGIESGWFSTNNLGLYTVSVQDGQHTITPQPENPTYWNFSPASITIDFPTQTSPFTQDFCVTPNGSIEDLEVVVIPLEEARPGFETDYAVQIKNKGNQTASGAVSLLFEEDYMTYETSTPMATVVNDELSWSFSNLEPFQSERFTFSMTLNTPTVTIFPLLGDEILSFEATVTGNATDAMPTDNTMTLEQQVVNSFDPNDKRCLEGKTILPSMVGEYVHYLIRFENLGTASAVNIVVKDEIDTTKFDMSTFVPLGGSHDYYVRTVGDGNTVEFIHENIFLDFNDATNDGYVLFKIKTLPTLTEGDTFSNDAEIYFDFNAPIITNDFITTVNATASIGSVDDISIKIHPNPTNGILNLSASTGIESVSVIDLQGRTLSTTDFISGDLTQQLDLSHQGSGVYFLKVTTNSGVSAQKVVVE